jgi:ubiquinone/menaquinone biosynthesis C-methylase UbiE
MRLLLLITLFVLFQLDGAAQDPWKNVYSQYAWAARDQWQKPEELIRLLKISSGSHVADVGCHEGYMTFKLAEAVGRKGRVYAVDVAADKLEKVRKRALEKNIPQILVIEGEPDNPRLPPNALDAVIILDTYHEMDGAEKMLEHVRTSLKKSGRLVICEPISDSRRNLPRHEQEKKHELSMEFAISDLRKAGFTIFFQQDKFIDRSREKGDKMWVVVAVKE